jgi:hypothetical protein
VRRCRRFRAGHNIMRAADHVTGGRSLVGAGNVLANNIE